MSRFERLFEWAGGAAFAGSLGFWAWWYLVALRRLQPWTGWRAVVCDTLLFAAFSAHHSGFARDAAKRSLAPIPRRLLRSVYVWIASILLVLVLVLWRAVGGLLYDMSGPSAVLLSAAMQLGGVWMITRAVAKIDALELAGIHAAGE